MIQAISDVPVGSRDMMWEEYGLPVKLQNQLLAEERWIPAVIEGDSPVSERGWSS
jgi:hypothetical protein